MGTVTYYVRSGRDTLRQVKLTLCCEKDMELLKRGISSLRRVRLKRLMNEAASQGVRLSYRDLSLLLLASKATIKRDLRSDGIRKD